MKQKPDLPQRRNTRLRGYNYSQLGSYFVTICVQHHQCIYGPIIDGKMQLNELGRIAIEWWNKIQQHYSSVKTDDYVIMPNHLHGIITLKPVGARSPRPNNTSPSVGARSPRPKDPPSLGKIVAYFKYQSTKHINQKHNTPGTRIWQRNYHDHIIRDDNDLQRLRQYIQNNPMKWELDKFHPDNIR